MSVIPTGHEIFKDGFNVSVNVETEELDKAIAKTKEFIELLREAEELLNLICQKTETDKALATLTEARARLNNHDTKVLINVSDRKPNDLVIKQCHDRKCMSVIASQ